MKLAVVIVNYNVQYFLEQCLDSVQRAVAGMDAEVWVVDNESVDGSVSMVRERFPWVKLIANQDNVGFSRANNQAMRATEAEHVLLLNPDTVVQEDTFRKVCDYMDAYPQTGGLGIQMVDGKGRFLPESKRGLPRPWVAFCKIAGIYRLFPRSKRFNWYYMGHVGQHETAEVEILSGAFMLMRKAALDKVGLLDETFFMYGEDIDLSWRLVQGGYNNVYYADSSIIHYKGESTKKGSLNYVFVFYNAMIIFARKHFSSDHARAFTWIINLAIYARAALAVGQRFVRALWLPLLDTASLVGGMWGIKILYADAAEKVYDTPLVLAAFGGYAAVWMGTHWLAGGYDRTTKPLQLLGGWASGTAVVLGAYSLLPEALRFSRALLLLAAAWTLVYWFASRSLLHVVLPKRFRWPGGTRRKCALVGSPAEVERVLALMNQTQLGGQIPVRVSPDETVPEGYLSRRSQLEEVVRVHHVDEVIFCAKDLSSTDIISTMSGLNHAKVEFRIAPPESQYIIGSNSINTSGDLFMLDVNSVSKPQNRRRKRTFDVLLALIALPLGPVLMWVPRNKVGYWANVLRVLVGRRTWVGYAEEGEGEVQLPPLKPGVVNPTSHLRPVPTRPEIMTRLNTVYARDYRMVNDVKITLQSLRSWGG